MAAKDEEIDEASTGSGTVMVGGMDHLVKDKAEEEIEVEVDTEEAKPKPKAAVKDADLEEDARLAYDVADDDEVEERGLSRRQRRNRQRKNSVTGRDQVIDQLTAKVDALTNMLGQMGNSQIGLTVQNLDNQLGAANQALTLADAEIKKAVAAGDLGRYDELRALKEEAQSRVWQLNRHKNGIIEEFKRGGGVRPQANGNGQEPAPQRNEGLDQRTQDFTQTFIERFDFDPNGTDETTLIIKAIDDSVAAEGYRSNTPLYWTTLEKKLAARGIYPAAEEGADDDAPPPRREAPVRRNGNGGRPPTAGGQGGRRGTGNTFRLDPMMREYLEGEGILHTEGLNDEQKGRRSRLLKGWQEGQRRLERGEIR